MNRSFLFAPGNVARRVEKALTLDADAVIVDLEDSVALAEKAATRKAVAAALERPRRPRGYVRVNARASALPTRGSKSTTPRLNSASWPSSAMKRGCEAAPAKNSCGA